MDDEKLPRDLQIWVEARKRFRLSHDHIAMTRELGLNPQQFGKLDNHRQEPWKAPLPAFIENLYRKRFGRKGPEVVMSIEERAQALRAKGRRDGRAGASIEAARKGADGRGRFPGAPQALFGRF